MMTSLLKLAAASFAAKQVERSIRNAIVRIILLMCATLAAVIGIGFLLGAAWMALASAFSPLVAAIAIGAGMMIVSAIVLAVSASFRHGRATSRSAQLPVAALQAETRKNDENINFLAALGLVMGIGYVIARSVMRK